MQGCAIRWLILSSGRLLGASGRPMMTPAAHASMTTPRAILTNLGLRATTGKIKVPASTATRLGKAH